MADGFNPYREWLGLAASSRPNHYLLLGIAPEDADGLRIAQAADERIALLRKSATKERLTLAQQLAKEILAARNCLLSSVDRQRYDAELNKAASVSPAVRVGLPLPPRAYEDDDEEVAAEDETLAVGILLPAEDELEAPPLAIPLTALSPPSPVVAVRERNLQRPARSRLVPAIAGIVAVSLLVLGGLWFTGMLSRHESPVVLAGQAAQTLATEIDRPTKWPVTSSETSSDPAAGEAPQGEDPAESAAEPTPAMASAAEEPERAEPMAMPAELPAAMPVPSAPPASLTPPAAAPPAWQWSAAQIAENQAATRKTIAGVRAAMADGELASAEEQLELAELEAIDASNAEEVAHVRAVMEYLRGFWRAADEGFLALSAGQEFEMEGKTVVVVERTPDRLVIRAGGRNRRYERKKLPPTLALFLAQRWLKADDANTPIFLAAFHVFDADGDRAEAKRLLETAKAAGNADADELLAALNAAAGDNS